MATDKEKLVEQLNEIAGELENFATDETLSSAVKSLKKITDKLSDVIGDVEENLTVTREQQE